MVMLKLLGIAAAMILAAAAAFISQLYSTPVMWVLAFALILISPSIALIKPKGFRISLCALFSLIINANYIFYIPYGNPISRMVIYGSLLVIFTFSMIYVIMRLSHSLKESRK